MQDTKICQCCYAPASKKCAKCCYSRYCSTACQKNDWQHHKKVCDRIISLATADRHSEPKFRQLQQEIKGNQGETCGLCLAIPRFRTELDRKEFMISKLCEPCFASACTKTCCANKNSCVKNACETCCAQKNGAKNACANKNSLGFYVSVIRCETITYRENGRFRTMAR